MRLAFMMTLIAVAAIDGLALCRAAGIKPPTPKVREKDVLDALQAKRLDNRGGL